MEAKPLSTKIYKKALALGVSKISLMFSGGNDEGNLYVGIRGDDSNPKKTLTEKESDAVNSFAVEIEDWAYNAYEYNGAGDGTDYGDNFLYDLKKKTVTTNSWTMERHESSDSVNKMKVE